MATCFQAVPLKRTWEVDLVKPLKTFISDTYSGSNSEDFDQALNEFNKLRNSTISKSIDKHESALEVLYRYHDQLVATEAKFPIAENQVRINFKWQDAFDKESLFSGKRTLTIASGSFERVCVLFNIAAMQSQIAETQNIGSDDGRKVAAKLFQQSCGIFGHLKDTVLSSVQADPTPDLHPDSLNALSALMLAQAQDCIVRKAMTDKMKPAMVAKLAIQCSDLYADAVKLLQLESIKSLWPKDWLNSVSSKQAAYHAVAQYYQSMVSKESKEFGEQIARLKHAKELMSAAEAHGGSAFLFADIQKRLLRDLQDAEKDNNFIYHAKIPEVSSLTAISKAAVAKSTPLSSPMSSQFKDLFEKVVPLAIQQALTMFENRRGELVNREIGRLREATQLLNSILASLNLPAAIEDLSGSGGVPPSLLEKAAAVRQNGGAAGLSRLINDLPALLQRNKEILDESVKVLDDEENADKQLRASHGTRWTRTASERLTESIRAEAARYRQIIDNAVTADGIVRQRYAQHREGFELLSRSDSEIEHSLPSSKPTASLEGHPAVTELRQLMSQIDEIRQRRDSLEAQLKDVPCDMIPKLTAAMAESGSIDEMQMSTEQLDASYGPLRELVSESIRQQETVLECLQTAHTEFTQANDNNQSGVTREQKLKELAAAYDSFAELRNNLEEGTKFYNDLTNLLVKFQSKVNDFCFARKTEKDELLKDLTANIARQPGGPPPAAPNYQQPPAAGAQQSSGSGDKVPSPKPAPRRSLQPGQAAASSQQPPSYAPQPPPVAAHSYMPPSGPQAPPPHAPSGQAAPYPTAQSSMPYPVVPPLPTGYNPYMNWQPPQPVGAYPGYPGHPQQPGYAPQQPRYPGYPPTQYPGQPPYGQPGYPQPYAQGYPGYPR